MTQLRTDEPLLPRFPGAREKFALFGEVLLVGVLVSICCLPVVTAPAALAAGAAHLRRTLAAESNTTAEYFRDFRAALRGGILIGVASLASIGILILNLVLVTHTTLPVPALIGGVSGLGLIVIAVGFCWAVSSWRSERGWRVRAVPRAILDDLVGSCYLLAACGFVVVSTWQLPPLIIPAMGCLALALVAVPARRRRRASSLQ